MKNIKKMLSIFDDLYRMIGCPSEVGVDEACEE